MIWILGEESTGERHVRRHRADEGRRSSSPAAATCSSRAAKSAGTSISRTTAATFYRDTLQGQLRLRRREYLQGDMASAGSIFAGLELLVRQRHVSSTTSSSRTSSPAGGAQLALNYAAAARQRRRFKRAGTGGRGSVVMLGVPLRDDHHRRESRGSDGSRARLLRRSPRRQNRTPTSTATARSTRRTTRFGVIPKTAR